MQIESNHHFVTADDVEDHLSEKVISEYLNRGMLVAVDIHIRQRTNKKRYLGRFFSRKSVERLTELDDIPSAVKTKAQRIIDCGTHQGRTLDDCIDHGADYKCRFYESKTRLKALNPDKQHLSISEKLARNKEVALAQWVRADTFFSSLTIKGNALSKPHHEDFARAIYDTTKIHPFVNQEGIWCYTIGDTESVRRHLGLRPSENVPPILREETLKSHDASSVGAYGLGNGRKGSRLGSE